MDRRGVEAKVAQSLNMIQRIRPAHLVAAIIGAALMYWWIWSADDQPSKQAQWFLEIVAGILLASASEILSRLLRR